VAPLKNDIFANDTLRHSCIINLKEFRQWKFNLKIKKNSLNKTLNFLTIFVFNFSRTNGAWYQKRALKVKVVFPQDTFVVNISDLYLKRF